MTRLFLVITFLVSYNCSIAQQLYFPGNDNYQWQHIDPQLLGWQMQNVDTLYDFLEANNTKAFLVLKDGKIVLEKYFGTYTADSSWYWASAGKTLTSMLTGIAQNEGFLNIQSPANNYLGQGWTSCAIDKETKITILNQLTMTSGLNDMVADPYCTLPGCLTYISDAGSRWAYHNAPYTMLDEVIANATGMSFSSYFNSRIRNKIGMDGFWYKIGYNNVYFSSAYGMARFGLLMLANGKWNGDSIISDTSYFSSMIKPSQTLNPSYGYLFWLNGQPSYMLPYSQMIFNGPAFPEAPSDMYAAMGKNGQLINVVPSKGLIMVRIGDAPNSETEIANMFNNHIWYYLNKVIFGTNARIENAKVDNSFIVFPNPVDKELFIKNNTGILNYRITLIDTNRKIVFTDRKVNSIKTENLAAGNYFLIISGNGIRNRFLISVIH